MLPINKSVFPQFLQLEFKVLFIGFYIWFTLNSLTQTNEIKAVRTSVSCRSHNSDCIV